jgi:hypothetical protein
MYLSFFVAIHLHVLSCLLQVLLPRALFYFGRVQFLLSSHLLPLRLRRSAYDELREHVQHRLQMPTQFLEPSLLTVREQLHIVSSVEV